MRRAGRSHAPSQRKLPRALSAALALALALAPRCLNPPPVQTLLFSPILVLMLSLTMATVMAMAVAVSVAMTFTLKQATTVLGTVS